MFGNSDDVVKTVTVSDANYSEEVQFEWKIVKGDRVEINVANLTSGEGDQQLSQMLSRGGQQTLSRDGTEGYLIANNGVVRLPLIGAVEIMGLTENQASEKLSNLYKQYLRNPFVSVKILNQKLYVLGEVKGPGVVQVTNGTMTLFEALARTGDLTNDADRTNVRVIRGGLRNPQVREVNLADMSQMRMTSLILQPNDIIYIQPRAMKAYNVAFAEQTPFFSMINTMMMPFISAISLKNGKVVDVVLFK
jgi:polysaccharide export outer membrane protein